jgi:hypothetical protein
VGLCSGGWQSLDLEGLRNWAWQGPRDGGLYWWSRDPVGLQSWSGDLVGPLGAGAWQGPRGGVPGGVVAWQGPRGGEPGGAQQQLCGPIWWGLGGLAVL